MRGTNKSFSSRTPENCCHPRESGDGDPACNWVPALDDNRENDHRDAIETIEAQPASRHIFGRARTGSSSDQSPCSTCGPSGTAAAAPSPASAPPGRRDSSIAGSPARASPPPPRRSPGTTPPPPRAAPGRDRRRLRRRARSTRPEPPARGRRSRPSDFKMSAKMISSSAPGTPNSVLAGIIMPAMQRRSRHSAGDRSISDRSACLPQSNSVARRRLMLSAI